MTRLQVGVVALACIAGAGCKSEPAKARAKRAVAANDFWPEAPATTATTRTRSFRYNPDNLAAYTMRADGGVPKDSTIRLDFKLGVDFILRAGTLPRERDAFIKKMDMTMNVDKSRIEMRLDSNELVFQEDSEVTRVTRDDPDPFFDIAGMTEKPMTTIRFSPENVVQVDTHEAHPLVSLGGAGDMLDSALLMFPDLPSAPVKPGHRWKMTRHTPLGATGAHADVTYELEYVGDGACPSRAGDCSLIAFTASAPTVATKTDEGHDVRATYGFAGKVFFDHERGAIDESRVRADIDTVAAGLPMRIGATYIIKPAS